MNTYEQQRDFFQKHWPTLRDALETDGAAAAVQRIEEFSDPLERRVLYMFARQGIVQEEWQGHNFDDYIAVVKAGIRECLRQAELEDEPATRAKRTDAANVLSYNLSADLANCWPEDARPREQRHYEAGLAAAEDCIRWREQLDKPAGPRSMAFWAKGVHELALGQAAAARASFDRSTDYAREAADGDDSAFGVLLGQGFRALAADRAGEPDAATGFAEALGTFEQQLEDDARKDDARFGIDQLRTAEQRL